MEFKELKALQQNHVANMIEGKNTLFVVDVDKDTLWETYLGAFPEGTNEVYRERRYYDCSCCRHFIYQLGKVVAIEDNEIVTIWDFETGDATFQPVVDAMSNLIKSCPITDVFISKEKFFGTDKNLEILEDGTIKTWHHFHIELPKQFCHTSRSTESSEMAVLRSTRNVFQRSLEEISRGAIETVLELIAQKSLYKGDEWKSMLKKFLDAHKEYGKLPESKQNNYCWAKSVELGGAIGKIKNHSIGTLLLDITANVDLDEAVRKYEAIVAPTHYKRPKAIFTKSMVEEAKKTADQLGLLDALARRYATTEDITINNVLFANRSTSSKIGGDVFDALNDEVTVNPRKFEKVEEVEIEHFIKEILPTTRNLELLFEGKHLGNLFSLIAPKNPEAKNLFKWNNNFSWAYNGNITDSMKQRVKEAGGCVNGVLRFSIQWNENRDNRNDYDAHCKEPDGNHIYYINKGLRHPSGGMLDVDIVSPGDKIAVENITWNSISKMQEGIYELFVHNYHHKGGTSGFSAEVEFDGQIYSFEYRKNIKQKENVSVATIKYSKEKGFEIIKSLPSVATSKTEWGIQTNQFIPVSMAMFSPNYWDDQKGVGNKHYFFVLEGCMNDGNPNGFFNEFLKEDFMKHKRVFEALGSKMKVEDSEEQLSGVGFSSTQRNTVVCKVDGSMSRVLKIKF